MKKYISRILFCLSVLVLPLSLASQPKTITVDGQVSDENGEPLAGATVRIEDSQTGTVTDGEGRYRIKVQSDGALVFSFMGYETQILTVRGSRQLNVVLDPDLNLLDEIVVVGYGTMKRSDLTGAISSVSSKTIDNYKTASVYEALGGMMAGVYVTSADGTPGTGFDIKIRGVGTVTGDSSPLYIVDGFEVDDLSSLSNQDIQSVEVLKDASASAIYGSRAANGVVLVTTKSGKNGRPEISYNGSASYRVLSRHLDVLSPYEFVKLQMELDPLKFTNMYYRTGNDEAGQPYRYQTMDDYHNVSGIDWQEEALGRLTTTQNYRVRIAGGNKDLKYNLSYGYFKDLGAMIQSGSSKHNISFSVSHKASDRFSANARVNYNESKVWGMGTSDGNRSLQQNGADSPVPPHHRSLWQRRGIAVGGRPRDGGRLHESHAKPAPLCLGRAEGQADPLATSQWRIHLPLQQAVEFHQHHRYALPECPARHLQRSQLFVGPTLQHQRICAVQRERHLPNLQHAELRLQKGETQVWRHGRTGVHHQLVKMAACQCQQFPQQRHRTG